jgi:RHS repeat-associated protein
MIGLRTKPCFPAYSLGIGAYSYSETYIAVDANGNVVDLVNMDGSSAVHYEYSACGEVISSTGAEAANNKIRFSTKYWDDEVQLGYWGLRFYSTRLSRWLNRDPIWEEAFRRRLMYDRGFVRVGLIVSKRKMQELVYVFADNEPISKKDAIGLATCCVPSERTDMVGEEAARYASEQTKTDPRSRGNREFCGLICCKGNRIWRSNGHLDLSPVTHEIQNGRWVVVYASCNEHEGETCGDGQEVGDYHSHPAERGFTFPEDVPCPEGVSGVRYYLGLPSGGAMIYDCDTKNIIYVD